jgi:hypothetical protein
MLFLNILGIVFKYLILPVPTPFLCCTFSDHESKIIGMITSSESGSWVSACATSVILLMIAHSTTSSAKSVSFSMPFTE